MRYALLSLALLVPALASAQSGEVFVQQAVAQANVGSTLSPLRLGSLESLTAAIPLVTPGTNVVVLDQTGSGNDVVVRQIGADNAAVLTQQGSGNRTDLTQTGDDNLFLTLVVGDGNEVDAVQADGGNVYGLYLVGEGTAHTVTQLGGNNLAVQVVGPGTTPVDIEQRGRGIEVRVERR
jgi:hypothetical protein